ncbi:NblA/ycf18 family protein [Microcoleus sp. N3A4]|uniref:NblA/ycf18 family protein n=1 Tax=Microcoleus sp. N3A4 TaxID=3055379 RepID=UPI002FD00937
METETSLTVEQQFKLKVYANQTLSLSAEESRILLVEMMRQNTIKDNEIKNLLNPNPNE